MKLGILVALISAGAASTGCIISSSDNPPPIDGPVESGDFDVAWILDGGCPAGATTAQVLSVDSFGDTYEDLFDCVAGGGLVGGLPLDDFTVVINITDSSTNTLFAQSGTLDASLFRDGDLVELDFAFPTDGGFYELTWSMTDTDGFALTCGDVGSGTILAELVGTNFAIDETFPCTDGGGVGEAKIELGDHDVVISALDEVDDSVLNDTLPATHNVAFGNELIDLGHVDFEFEAL